MPSLPDSMGLLGLTKQGIKKAMANETDVSNNYLSLRQNGHPQMLTESTAFTKQQMHRKIE